MQEGVQVCAGVVSVRVVCASVSANVQKADSSTILI